MSEQKSPKVRPQSLLTEKLLKEALKADKGDDAEMISYEVKDFTSKGDNYASVVTSGIVRYRQGEEEKEVTYIAKCNPCRGEAFETFASQVFMKEVNFYQKIAPLINAELEAAGQEPLRMPNSYCSHLVNGQEVILLNDLRPGGFKMFDRKKGMDMAHVTLVLRELARLHATSTVVEAKMSEPIEVTHDFLLKDFDNCMGPSGEIFFDSIISNTMENCAVMAEEAGGYDKAVKWLRDSANQGTELFVQCLKRSPPFAVVCHGDCWNNNILFKYDEAGKPIDLRLLDLQITRKASLATDLNYLLYSSLNGSVRKANLQTFLKIYYDSYEQMLSVFGKPMPFTMDDLKKEFHKQNMFGLLMCLMVVPFVVADAKDFDLDDLSGDLQTDMAHMKEQMAEQVKTNPLLQPRLLDTFDEMIDYGVIS